MEKLVVLVGLPGSGKSTLVNGEFGEFSCAALVYSTDSYLETLAGQMGKTYNEVFKDNIGYATEHMNYLLNGFIAANGDVIWDQTNMTVKKRKSILSKFPNSYEKTCWCIQPPQTIGEWFELHARLDSRPGKNIPENVLNSMCSSYIEPELDEGFSYIKIVDIFGKTIKEKGISK